MTKYCTDSDYGTVDNKTVLDKEDDAAAVNMGGSWRMPTKDEMNELRNNCTWEWITQNGVNGYKVTGSNKNTIFLPAAGYRLSTGLGCANGNYWSSSLKSDYSCNAFSLHFNSGTVGWNYLIYRNHGGSVRGVFSK